MSNVTLTYPDKDCTVLHWHVNGWLPQFLYRDLSGNPLHLVSETLKIGSIKNGRQRDIFGNKDVKHFNVGGTIDLVPLQFKWIGGKVSDGTMYWNTIQTPTFIRYGFISTGLHLPSNGKMYYVDRNDSDVASGKILRETDSTVLAEFSITKNFIGFVAGSLQYNVHYVTKATALGKSRPFYISDEDRIGQGTAYGGGINGTGAIIKASQSYETARRLIPDFVPPVIGDIVPESLTDDIFSQLVIPEVNNCENLKDFRDFKAILPDLLKLIRARKNFKTLAEFWLWYKYSFSTTALDIEAYYKFFCNWAAQSADRNDNKKMHLTYNDVTMYNGQSYKRTTSYIVYTNTYNCGVLEALGLDLNLANTWDMVPYSFILDWFVNIGDILARIDHSDTLAKLNVYSVLVSTKCTTNYSLGAIGGFGTLIISNFERNLSRSLPVGNISISIKNPIHHILDGTSLIVARR